MKKRTLLTCLSLLFGLCELFAHAEYPQWWYDCGIVNTNDGVVANDYASVNQGQLKWVTTQVYCEFTNYFPASDCSLIAGVVANFSTNGNNCSANLGQLKQVAHYFYDVLNAYNLTNALPAGMSTGPYPWSAYTNQSQDYAVANLGQLKYIFSFDLQKIPSGVDSDGDGVRNWQEAFRGSNPADFFD